MCSCEGAVLHLNPQSHPRSWPEAGSSSGVEVGPGLGLRVADLVVSLQQKDSGQHAVPAVVGAVERREIGVSEQPAPQRGQQTVEGVPPHTVKYSRSASQRPLWSERSPSILSPR